MKRKNRTVLFFRFGIVFLILSILFLQVLETQTPRADSVTKEKSLSEYPSTPEGVVEAFVKVGFDGAGVETIGDVRKRLQYTIWDDWPGWDSLDISLKYKVIKIKEDDKEAIVKVIHECIGWTALEFLKIERKNEEVVYHLKKDGGVWKISFPDHAPYISVKTAIKLLEWGIKYYREDTERVVKMKKNIEILKKYL